MIAHSNAGGAIELRHLRYFVAVAEERSVVGAAERLHLAQPALSRQIHDLERAVDSALFTREARGVELTPAGHACHLRAQQIIQDCEHALDRARLAAQGLVGRCVIGTTRVLIWNGLLARVVERVRNEFPGIEIEVEEQSLHSQWTALTDCTTDLGLGAPPPSEYTQLSSEMHALDVLDTVALSRRHTLATRDALSLKDLENETFIHREGLESFRLVRAEFARVGFRPRVEQSAESLDSILVLVRAGRGWTIIPRSIRHYLATSTAVVPLERFALPSAYARIWRRGEKSPVVRTVLSLLRRMSDEMQLGGGPATAEMTEPAPDDATPCPVSRLEFRHLRYFTAIVEEGSIGRAAERMGLTQPALSRQLRDLENVVGAALLDRASRGVSPTLAGQSLYEDAREILTSATRLPGEAKRATRGAKGRCIIGVVPTPLVQEIVIRAVHEAAQRFPDLAISVVDVPTPRQHTALANAGIDIGMGHSYPTPELDAPIVRVPMADDVLDTALVCQTSPLADRESISLKELVDVPFLFMKREFSPGFYDMVLSGFARAGCRPRIDREYDGLPTVWTLAAKDMGWCLAPRSQRKEPPPGLAAIPLSDFALSWGANLVCREYESSPAVLAVRDLILRAAASPRSEA